MDRKINRPLSARGLLASLTREYGLVELVHDPVAVRLLVPEGFHAGEEAGRAQVYLLLLALLAPNVAQLSNRFNRCHIDSRTSDCNALRSRVPRTKQRGELGCPWFCVRGRRCQTKQKRRGHEEETQACVGGYGSER